MYYDLSNYDHYRALIDSYKRRRKSVKEIRQADMRRKVRAYFDKLNADERYWR